MDTMPEDHKEETLQTETIHRGRSFNFQKRTVRLSSGKTITREIVDHPGSVAIIPLLDKETVIMVKQYRNAAEKILLEVPAGTLNYNEYPEECAKRELLEETGYYPQTLKKLIAAYTTPGYSSEKMHIYVATQLTKKIQTPEEDETINISMVRLRDIKQMIIDGEIEDLKTVCSILMFDYMAKLKSHE